MSLLDESGGIESRMSMRSHTSGGYPKFFNEESTIPLKLE